MYTPQHIDNNKTFLPYASRTYKYRIQKQKYTLGDDFNLVTGDTELIGQDDKEQLNTLNNLINITALKNVYKKTHLSFTETTHYSRTHHIAARLDRIYTHESITVNKVKHLAQTLTFTNHIIVIVRLKINPTHRTNDTYWKLNNTLLENCESVAEIKKLAAEYTQRALNTYALEHWEDF